MSKIVIYTQYRENYWAHRWDGEGECPQYWKSKGGHIYLIPNLDREKAELISDFLRFNGSHIFLNCDEYSEEYVIDAVSLEDEEDVGEYEWETAKEVTLEEVSNWMTNEKPVLDKLSSELFNNNS